MLVRTKLILASIATLSLLGTAVAAAAEDPLADEGAPAGESFRGRHFVKENGTVTGRHVAFEYDASTGAITDYTRLGPDDKAVTLFDSITVAEYNASAAKAKARGAVLVAGSGDLVRWMVFDAKNAAFGIGSPSGNTVTLVVPDGVSVAYHAGEEGWSPEGVLLTYANSTARLVLNGNANLTVDGQTITVELREHGRLGFRIDGHPWEELKEKGFAMKLRHHMKEKRGDKPDHEDKRKRGDEMKARAQVRRDARG